MSRSRSTPLALALRLALVALPALAEPPVAAPAAGAPPEPPRAARHEHVDTWHGRRFEDPWHWLREKEKPEVRAYLEAENAYTAAMTAGIEPFAEALYREMLAHIKQTDLSVPVRRGKFHYYQRTEEGLQYPILCRRAAGPDRTWDATAAEQVLIDQNELARGLPFLGLGDTEVSDDDQRLAFTTDGSGFRQYRLFVKELGTGVVTGPLAERVTGVAWAADSRTLFFTTEDAVTKRSDTLWRLRLGGQPEAVLVEQDALFTLQVGRTNDRKYLVASASSYDAWESRLLPSDQPGGTFRVVLPREKGHKYQVEHRAGRLYLLTNKGAKDFRVVTAPVDDPSPRRWTPFVDHRPGVLVEAVEPFRDFLVVTEQRDGLRRFRVHTFATGRWREVSFDEPIYEAQPGDNPEFDTREFRFTFESPVTPPSVYDYDLGAHTRLLRKRQEVPGGFDPSAYVTERRWATARDGARIPISLTYRKGLARDGTAPLWLYGYGSYGYPTAARFSAARLPILDRGVVAAIAHVRGGNELGERWHDDGKLMRKKNSFLDFIDCAEFLVKERYAARRRLFAEGGSAGGLLVGAVLNLRPDLFGAVHAAVPFVDVINTMMDPSLPLTVPEYLEWGDPNEKGAFEYMLSYSPYDQVAPRAYPPLLVTTSFNDSQVMYWEPAKWVAKLRASKTDANPLLLKVKLEPAGHGGASGRYDRLRDMAFEQAWLLTQVGVTR